MSAKNFGKMINYSLKENSSFFGSDHPKTENNHVSMWSLLTEIDIGNSGDYTPTVQSNSLVSEVQVISQSPDNVLWHPVTLLHHICSDLKWPSPTYVVISEDVTATRHVFTLECKVLKHKASGVGLSKRKAKRSASMALLEKLNDNEDLGKYADIIYSQMYIFDKDSEIECSSEDGGAGNATSELYKMCYARRWPLPVYGLLSMEGPVHNRLYRIGCTMPGFSELDEASHCFAAEGKGHTKREAKHAASVALLDKILGDMSSNPSSSCTTNSFQDRGKECESSQKYKMSKNATSLLNELCMSYNWSLPIYEYLPESGSGTMKLFTVGCSLLGHTELGTGFTKKGAKHAASTALLLKIREYLEDSLPVFNDFKENPSREKIKAECLCHTEIPKDPITSLHETCASRSWPYPTYKLLFEENVPDNKKIFTIGCFVLGYTPLVKGSGCNKKKAKHAASRALLDKIRSSDGNCGSPLHLHSKNCICDLNLIYQEAKK